MPPGLMARPLPSSRWTPDWSPLSPTAQTHGGLDCVAPLRSALAPVHRLSMLSNTTLTVVTTTGQKLL